MRNSISHPAHDLEEVCSRYVSSENNIVVVVVFLLNRPFYPALSVHPVSVLIPYPKRDTDSVVTDCETEEDQKMKNNRK